MAGDEKPEHGNQPDDGEEAQEQDPAEEPEHGSQPSSAGVGPPRSLRDWWASDIGPLVGRLGRRLREASLPVRVGLSGAAFVLLGLSVWSLLLRPGPEPGSSPSQVVSSFLFAQSKGDCERVIDLVSEASWSEDGDRSRGEFLEQCEEALDGYQLNVAGLSVSVTDPDDNSDELVVTISGGDGSFRGQGGAAEGRLVRDDGEWKVELDDTVLRMGRSVEDTMHGYIDAYDEVLGTQLEEL